MGVGHHGLMSAATNATTAAAAAETAGQSGSFPGVVGNDRARKPSTLSVSSPFNIEPAAAEGGGSQAASARQPPSVSLKDPKKLMVLITHMGHPVTGIPLDLQRVGPRYVLGH